VAITKQLSVDTWREWTGHIPQSLLKTQPSQRPLTVTGLLSRCLGCAEFHSRGDRRRTAIVRLLLDSSALSDPGCKHNRLPTVSEISLIESWQHSSPEGDPKVIMEKFSLKTRYIKRKELIELLQRLFGDQYTVTVRTSFVTFTITLIENSFLRKKWTRLSLWHQGS
jgi:hypothetical protein